MPLPSQLSTPVLMALLFFLLSTLPTLSSAFSTSHFVTAHEWRLERGAQEQLLHQALLDLSLEFTSTTAAKKVIRRKLVRVNGIIVKKPDTIVREGDCIEFLVKVFNEKCSPSLVTAHADMGKLGLEVIWEDDYVAIVNKPFGMPVFPTEGGQAGYNVQAMCLTALKPPAEVDDLEEATRRRMRRPQPVHRLDKDTGGLLVIAKSYPALTKLTDAFGNKKSTSVKKVYSTLVLGHPQQTSGTIEISINKKHAITHYKTIDVKNVNGQDISTLEVTIETGRTHQIRRHLSMLGCPIVGDVRYASAGRVSKEAALRENFMYLCATGLKFDHPVLDNIQVEQNIKIPQLFRERILS